MMSIWGDADEGGNTGHVTVLSPLLLYRGMSVAVQKSEFSHLVLGLFTAKGVMAGLPRFEDGYGLLLDEYARD
jgi:hypothetical protein